MDNRISFTSGIRISNCSLQKSICMAERFKPNYTGKSWDLNCWTMGKEAYSDRASICTIAGVQNGDQVFMFHAKPLNVIDHTLAIKKLFEEKISTMKKNGKEVKGILVGNCGDMQVSKDASEILNFILKSLGVKTSKVQDQTYVGASSLAYSIKKDTWDVYSIGNKKITPENLDQFYKKVSILPDDNLIFKNK